MPRFAYENSHHSKIPLPLKLKTPVENSWELTMI